MKRTAIVIASLFVAAPSLAQDGTETAMNRTPTNAQRFLAEMPPAIVGVGNTGSAGLVILPEGPSTFQDVCTTSFTGKRAAWKDNRWVAQTMHSIPSASIGLNVSTDNNLRITQVFDGFGAKRAGLTTRDTITAIDDKRTTTLTQLNQALAQRLAAGGQAMIAVVREGVSRTVAVDLIRATTGSFIEVPFDNRPESATVDWSQVEEVTTGEGSGYFWMVLAMPGDRENPSRTLSYTVKPSRDRVLAAAQYLQQACDRTQELGF